MGKIKAVMQKMEEQGIEPTQKNFLKFVKEKRHITVKPVIVKPSSSKKDLDKL